MSCPSQSTYTPFSQSLVHLSIAMENTPLSPCLSISINIHSIEFVNIGQKSLFSVRLVLSICSSQSILFPSCLCLVHLSSWSKSCPSVHFNRKIFHSVNVLSISITSLSIHSKSSPSPSTIYPLSLSLVHLSILIINAPFSLSSPTQSTFSSSLVHLNQQSL